LYIPKLVDIKRGLLELYENVESISKDLSERDM